MSSKFLRFQQSREQVDQQQKGQNASDPVQHDYFSFSRSIPISIPQLKQKNAAISRITMKSIGYPPNTFLRIIYSLAGVKPLLRNFAPMLISGQGATENNGLDRTFLVYGMKINNSSFGQQ
ncbi:MAG TPA: hypothetical protein PKD23_04190 [Bellilinea sp.]|nr:hypothetical protein [Bellilinea sp.]